MEIICFQDEAFFALIECVVERLGSQREQTEEKWLDTEACMALLKIKSKSTLQSLRDNGVIRFSQPTPKLILYDRDSIYQYLDKHAKGTFNYGG